MSTIRRQSIISSLVIYSGFVVGLLNTYFFGEERYFTTAEYGLTSIFIAIATMMMAFANMAMPSFISKFFPYYKDHLPDRKNDLMTWALLVSGFGFLLVLLAGWFFKDLVIRKYAQHSPELVNYYYWIFPMGLGLTVYAVLEVYAWNIGKAVLTNFLKEVQWRLIVTVLIVLFITNVISDFDLFIKLYAMAYPAVALTLFGYLVFTGKIHFTFSISKVSRRYFRKILTFCLFIYSGFLILTVSQVFDQLVIAAVLTNGMAKAGIFGLAQIMASVIQAPQRGIIAASIPHLSRAWKEKNMALLQKIYQRSSINQLIFASGLFALIALNYKEAIYTFNQKEAFLLGFDAFLLLGLTRVVDMGTGMNSQIIGTSNYWRFELISGIALLVVMLPLTYILAKQYDIMGPAIANLVSISLYNLVRILFLWKKFRLFPFTRQSVYTIIAGAVAFVVCYYAFVHVHGFWGLVVRSAAFILLYGGAVFYFRLSPDLMPVMESIGKRFRKTKS